MRRANTYLGALAPVLGLLVFRQPQDHPRQRFPVRRLVHPLAYRGGRTRVEWVLPRRDVTQPAGRSPARPTDVHGSADADAAVGVDLAAGPNRLHRAA